MLRRWLLAILLCLNSTSLAAEPVDRLLPPRPSFDDYQDQNRFVAEVLAWERKRQALLEQARSGPIRRAEASAPASPGDWHHVTGPEDLDTALRNADGYRQPHYRERYRYNRTTHISFPLKRLPPEELADESVPLAEAPPTLVRDKSLEQFPEQVLHQLERIQELSLDALPRPPRQSVHASLNP